MIKHLLMHEMQETRVQSLVWEESSEGGNGTPFQYSCLENFMDRGAWWATVHVVAKSRTQLSDWESNEKSSKDVKYGRSWEGVEA